jgi:hypothetical protein
MSYVCGWGDGLWPWFDPEFDPPELELPEPDPLELVLGAAGFTLAPHPVRMTASRRRTEYFIYSLSFVSICDVLGGL